MLAVPAGASPGQRVLVGFDDARLGTLLYNQYEGVEFVDPSLPLAQVASSSGVYTVAAPSGGTASGGQAMLSKAFYNCGKSGAAPAVCAEARLHFDEPQSDVAMTLGLGRTPGYGTIDATGYDAKGNVVASGSTGKLCTGSVPLPVQFPIELTDVATRIVSVTIRTSDTCPAISAKPASADAYPTLFLDNLAYTKPFVERSTVETPPVVVITEPAPNSFVPVPSEGDPLAVRLRVFVTANVLRDIRIGLNGAAPIVAAPIRDPKRQGYSVAENFGSTTGVKRGANVLVVTATDVSGNTVTDRVTFHTGALPSPPTSESIHPLAVEVTQGFDTGPLLLTPDLPAISQSPLNGYDIDWQPAPFALSAEKDTLIRVYGGTSETGGNAPLVPAVAEIAKDNCSVNCVVEASALPVDPQLKANAAGIPVGQLSYALVTPTGQSELQNPSKTWNFIVHAMEATGDVVVTLHIDPSSLDNAVPECGFEGDRECRNDNTVRLHLHFEPAVHVPLDTVDIVAAGTFSCNGTSVTLPAAANAGTENSTGSTLINPQQDADFWSAIAELWPVVVDPRYVYYSTANVGTDDGAAVMHALDFYSNGALILGRYPVYAEPGALSCAHRYDADTRNANGTTVTGMAEIGSLGAWADADDPLDAVHELQHNYGFPHWDCDFGASDCSDKFPTQYGGLDGIGTDFAGWARHDPSTFHAYSDIFALPPGDPSSLLSPKAHDLMSYGQNCALFGGSADCSTGRWASGYDRELVPVANILATEVGFGQLTVDPPVQLMHGSITFGKSRTPRATIDAVYSTEGFISNERVSNDPARRYSIEGYDRHGSVLFAHNFTPSVLASHREGAPERLDFFERIRAVSNLDRVAVKRGGVTIGFATSTRAPIGVQILNPQPSSSLSGSASLRWDVSNPRRVPLSTLVEYAVSEYGPRIAIAEGVLGNALAIDTNRLPGAQAGFLFVTVSDGVQDQTDKIGPLRIAPKPPLVRILQPRATQRIAAGENLFATGNARELAFQGRIAGPLRWSIDGTAAGTGRNVRIAGLTPGTHTLQLQATDSAGATGSATVRLTVDAFVSHRRPE